MDAVHAAVFELDETHAEDSVAWGSPERDFLQGRCLGGDIDIYHMLFWPGDIRRTFESARKLL